MEGKIEKSFKNTLLIVILACCGIVIVTGAVIDEKEKKAARGQNNGYPVGDIDNSHDNVKKTEREICLERKGPTTIKGKVENLIDELHLTLWNDLRRSGKDIYLVSEIDEGEKISLALEEACAGLDKEDSGAKKKKEADLKILESVTTRGAGHRLRIVFSGIDKDNYQDYSIDPLTITAFYYGSDVRTKYKIMFGEDINYKKVPDENDVIGECRNIYYIAEIDRYLLSDNCIENVSSEKRILKNYIEKYEQVDEYLYVYVYTGYVLSNSEGVKVFKNMNDEVYLTDLDDALGFSVIEENYQDFEEFKYTFKLIDGQYSFYSIEKVKKA